MLCLYDLCGLIAFLKFYTLGRGFVMTGWSVRPQNHEKTSCGLFWPLGRFPEFAAKRLMLPTLTQKVFDRALQGLSNDV